MKKLVIALIILICFPLGYIGIHRVIYNSDYKRITVLNTEIYKLKLTIIDYKPDAATINGITFKSTPPGTPQMPECNKRC